MSYDLTENIAKTWQQVKSNLIDGTIPGYINYNSNPLVGTGVAVYFNQDSSQITDLDTRNHVALSPEATILIKKKVFSTLRGANDLRFMDKTEKMLLRATKALFAYKVQQIRAYESLTKFNDFYDKNSAYDLCALATLINESSALESIAEETGKYKAKNLRGHLKNIGREFKEFIGDTLFAEDYSRRAEDIREIIKRKMFSEDKNLTTWVVDHSSAENQILGPGTGVIELTLFRSFNTSVGNSSSPASASMSLSYPYRIGNIIDSDIEIAIEEALNGTLGILSSLTDGPPRNDAGYLMEPSLDGLSALSAAFELAGEDTFDTAIDTDYIRRKLKTFYLGKPFVSASDIVHFYIKGNRTFTEYNSAAKGAFDSEFLQIDEAILKAEYQLYTNQAISYEEYKKMRSLNDNSFGMTHVYAGIVTDTSESFSGGFWDLKVNCTDNMSWLKWSRFQSEPAISDPKNILEDPLTPFELSKDTDGSIIGRRRELLYENKALLQSGLLRYDSGLLAGQNAYESNLIQGQYNGIGSLNGKKVAQHPSGFVYRWKDGIVTATAGFSASNPTGESTDASQWGSQYSVTVTNTVLNNLDIPNVLSILIVGQPYNIETFIEQAFTAHNISDKSGRLSQTDPLTGVLDTVRKQNKFYGNFHPYRSLTMSSTTTEQALNNAGNRNIINDTIGSLQERKRELRRRARALTESSQASGIGQSAIIGSLQNEMNTIDAAIKRQIEIGRSSDRALSSEEKIGIQISLGGSTNLPVADNEQENEDITRAMMMVGAQRRIEDVRLNRDRNLFIVSDQYDAADIRPFILSLNRGSWKLFDGKYVDVWQSCNEITKYLHLEFFANSQGHLEFRPPLWNRVPLTILREAIRVQKSENKEIIPRFITDLFSTRIESLYILVHTMNVKIALAALMLGRYPDKTMIPNVPFTGKSSLGFFGIEESGSFGSGSITNTIGNILTRGKASPVKEVSALRLSQTEFVNGAGDYMDKTSGKSLSITASFQEKGDVLSGNTETLLGTFDKIIEEQSSLVSDIETVVRANSDGNSQIEPAAKYDEKSLNAIRDSFKRQFGRDPAEGLISKGKSFTENDLLWKLKDIERLDQALYGNDNILAEIKKAISIRDSYVSMLQANLAKVEELNEIEQFLETGEADQGFQGSESSVNFLNKASDFLAKSANALQTTHDILTGKVAEGTVYDHLIEDDTRNLLGYGSGKRFILKDEYIMSANFSESPPEFTRIDVNGNAPLIGDNINRSFEGLYFWAGATDFDLWRQYGYKYQQKNLPFVSDPEGQGKPYAILELAMQRISINRGSVTVPGNEFYQPGDTVYLPSKGLLYYVSSVSHSFSFGSSFTTSLKLEYGHPPGDYIPGPLDVIGQQLVSNFLEDPAILYRSSETDDNYRTLQPDSSLVFPTGGVGESLGFSSPANLLAFSDNQIRFTNMMIDLIGSLSGNKYVLIRGFAMDEADSEGIQEAREKMAVVRYLLENPSQLQQAKPFSGGDDLINLGASVATGVSSLFGGGSAGTTKQLTEMRLPNNLPVIPIPANKIIDQVSFFRKTSKNNVGEISCLDRLLASSLSLDKLNVEVKKSAVATEIDGIFPKGGPSQGSWLDLRNFVSGFNFTSSFKSNVVEVGIISIPSSIFTKSVPGGE